MRFWGIEVKPGQTVSCDAGNDCVLHISQAALGETKKGSENVVVSVKAGDKKVVIGTLSAEKHPQIMYDLIFEKEFELSHSSKTASVFLCGYRTLMPDPFDSDSGEDEDEEEETNKNPVGNIIFEKTEGKAPAKAGIKTEGKAPVKVGKMETHDDDSDEDESDDSYDDLDLSDDDEDMSEDDSSDDEMDESEEEDEEIPKKPEIGKKRVVETTLKKTPASDKKAKIATPSGQKTGDKKGAHVATPHPAKQASKTTVNSKSKEKSPKSAGGSHACKSCTKTFGSDAALQSRQKAKHNAAK